VVALGCLDGRDERGRGQGCYSRRLGQRPGTDTTSRVEFKEELGLNLLGGRGTHPARNKGLWGEGYCLDWGFKSGLRDTGLSLKGLSTAAESEF
jgi:hypothetical protein